MTSFESALVILIFIWSVIFVLVGIFIAIIFWRIKQAVDKVNKILQTTENIAERVEMPIRTISSGLLSLLGKPTVESIKEIKKRFGKKK